MITKRLRAKDANEDLEVYLKGLEHVLGENERWSETR